MGASRRYRFREGEAVPDGLRRIARGRIDHALDELRGKTKSSPEEAVHEARKNMKKLRALLRLTRNELGDEVYRRENECFRDAGRRLSGVRDADVMLETLDGLDGDFRDLRRLLKEHRSDRDDAREAVITMLGEALVAGRQLDARQRATLVGISRRAAIISLGGWSGAALLFGAYDTLRFNDDPDGVARLALTILLGGLTTSALVFLLNEGPLRPVYAIAFRDDPPERTEGLGVRLRLIFSWVLGAGVPFLGVALAFLGVGASDYDSLRPAVLTLVAAGLLAGAPLTPRAPRP